MVDVIDWTSESTRRVSSDRALIKFSNEVFSRGVDVDGTDDANIKFPTRLGENKIFIFRRNLPITFTVRDEKGTAFLLELKEGMYNNLEGLENLIKPFFPEEVATITLDITPIDAIVQLNGDFISGPFPNSTNVDAGDFNLKISKEGFKTLELGIRIIGGQDNPWTFTLEPLAPLPEPEPEPSLWDSFKTGLFDTLDKIEAFLDNPPIDKFWDLWDDIIEKTMEKLGIPEESFFRYKTNLDRNAVFKWLFFAPFMATSTTGNVVVELFPGATSKELSTLAGKFGADDVALKLTDEMILNPELAKQQWDLIPKDIQNLVGRELLKSPQGRLVFFKADQPTFHNAIVNNFDDVITASTFLKPSSKTFISAGTKSTIKELLKVAGAIWGVDTLVDWGAIDNFGFITVQPARAYKELFESGEITKEEALKQLDRLIGISDLGIAKVETSKFFNPFALIFGKVFTAIAQGNKENLELIKQSIETVEIPAETEDEKWDRIEKDRKERKEQERKEDEDFFDRIEKERQQRREDEREEDKDYWDDIEELNKDRKEKQQKDDKDFWDKIEEDQKKARDDRREADKVFWDNLNKEKKEQKELERKENEEYWEKVLNKELPSGKIRINSEPQGADVWIDGKFKFVTTPFTISLLPNTYTVRLELENYNPVEIDLTWEEGVDKEELIDLSSAKIEPPLETANAWKYSIRAVNQTTGEEIVAKVFVDGVNTFQVTPTAIFLLPENSYNLQLTKFGFESANIPILTEPLPTL